jgi:hypothetical protein
MNSTEQQINKYEFTTFKIGRGLETFVSKISALARLLALYYYINYLFYLKTATYATPRSGELYQIIQSNMNCRLSADCTTILHLNSYNCNYHGT